MNIKSKNDFLIVELEGEVDEYMCLEVKPKIDFEYKEKGLRDIVFDFKDATFVDSSALGMILGRYKRACEKNGKVYIAGARDQVKKVFEVSDIYKLIKPYETVDEIVK